MASILDGQVDSKGNFQIDSVQVGSYTIEVEEGDSSGAFLNFVVKYHEAMTHSSSIGLTPSRNSRGLIQTQDSFTLSESL